MRRPPVYSKSRKGRTAPIPLPAPSGQPAPAILAPGDDPTPSQRLLARGVEAYRRHRGTGAVLASALLTLALLAVYDHLRPPPQDISQDRLAGAVNYALDHRPPAPAATTLASAKIMPAVVRVDGYNPKRDPMAGAGEAFPTNNAVMENAPIAPGEKPVLVATGVVIDDDGSILTDLHVVSGARKLRVTFADGTVSDASVRSTVPENDTALLKPDQVPDDLQSATLGTSQQLRPGDPVVAVGYPFSIGPSVSAGIVSGTGREYEVGDRHTLLLNLIQFDAAANPGNLGGPLVNGEGDVVGMVAAIVNPSGTETSTGVAFAVPIDSADKAIGDSPL